MGIVTQNTNHIGATLEMSITTELKIYFISNELTKIDLNREKLINLQKFTIFDHFFSESVGKNSFNEIGAFVEHRSTNFGLEKQKYPKLYEDVKGIFLENKILSSSNR